MAQQCAGLRCPPLFPSRLSNPFSPTHVQNNTRWLPPLAAVVSGPIPSPQTNERFKLKKTFEDVVERCRNDPMEGVSFTLEDFHAALEKYDFNSEMETKVKGTVYCTDANGALVNIPAKSVAYLPVQEACIHRIKHVEKAGIYPGLREEFVIIGEKRAGDGLILSLRAIQYDLAWERCRQLQAEDVVVNGKVVDANRGGVLVVVEGLKGFVPFSEISTEYGCNKSTAGELLNKELPLKFLEVAEDQSKIILSNRKVMDDRKAKLRIGSVVTGTVQSLQCYGAFINMGGINGLLHISQISHDRISDIATVLKPGDTLKVIISGHDPRSGKIRLSTKQLEPNPGDMIRDPKLVFEKAEEMAQTFRLRIAQAEAMARADILSFQPERGLTLTTEGILGPITPKFPAKGLDLNNVLPSS